MTEIIGVRFKKVGKIYYFDPAGLTFAKGARAVVETSRGIEMSEVVLPNRHVEDEQVVQPLRCVLREATPEDIQTVEENQRRAKDAFEICRTKIAAHKLDMKLIEAEYTFDGTKILFYFTADGRIDFRELVRDLASVFRMRIELRQIGVRDEAKLYGGLGICGRPLCCATFLDDFQPVSIKMAKEQNLSLNPTKISGTCGRLMCCLKYEQEAYEELNRTTPKVDSTVQTPDGVGTVVDVNLLRGCCRVRLQNSTDAPKTYCKADCHALRGGCPRQGAEDIITSDKPDETALAAASDPAPQVSAPGTQDAPERPATPRPRPPKPHAPQDRSGQDSQQRRPKPAQAGASSYNGNGAANGGAGSSHPRPNRKNRRPGGNPQPHPSAQDAGADTARAEQQTAQHSRSDRQPPRDAAQQADRAPAPRNPRPQRRGHRPGKPNGEKSGAEKTGGESRAPQRDESN